MKSFEELNLTPDLSTVIDAHIQGVHNNLADGCKDFAPKLIIEAVDPFADDSKRELIICLVNADFNDHDVKHDIMEQLGREVYHKQKLPISVSLATECWMSKTIGVRPSEADDRIEAISIAAMGIDRSSDMQMMPFKRDKEQNIIEGAFMRYSGGKCESPLLESFYRGFWNEFDKREKGVRR